MFIAWTMRGMARGLCLGVLTRLLLFGIVSSLRVSIIQKYLFKFKGIVKYAHSESVQSVSINPVTGQVLSCSTSDFGMWSPDTKAVVKTKVAARICCSEWTPDGQHFAMGMFNGVVSIRNRFGDEIVKIERREPIWTLCWSFVTDSEQEPFLIIGDWSQKMAFYHLNGTMVRKERDLGFDPCSISVAHTGDYLVVAGSDKKVTLFTLDGIRIQTVCEREGWVWSCAMKPKHNVVAVGSQEGSIALYQVTFITIHGLYQDIYAYRENLTEVFIQHLATQKRSVIQCRDHVKKVAIYRDRLSVQLSDRIIIYQKEPGESLEYTEKESIVKKVDCNLLVVTANNVLLCLEKRLQMLTFTGEKEREWHMDALVRYIKVIGGPPSREGLLVGLKNGQVLIVYLNNPLHINVLKLDSGIRCVDLSQHRKKVAIVDEHSILHVYNIVDKTLLYTQESATSVAWNTEHEGIIISKLNLFKTCCAIREETC